MNSNNTVRFQPNTYYILCSYMEIYTRSICVIYVNYKFEHLVIKP